MDNSQLPMQLTGEAKQADLIFICPFTCAAKRKSD